MAEVKTRRQLDFEESMDLIMQLFYRPDNTSRQYCCEPDQIQDIKDFVTALEDCDGDKIEFRTDAIPTKDQMSCTNPDELPAHGSDKIKVTLGTKNMYISVILCYYIASKISGGYAFDLHTALRLLLPGMDAATIIYRTAMSEMISKRILFNKEENESEMCSGYISEFKRKLLSLKDFSEEALDKWAHAADSHAAKSADAVLATKKVTDAQEEIVENFLKRMRQQSKRKSSGGKKSKRKSRRF
jgi:hypothetical protein